MSSVEVVGLLDRLVSQFAEPYDFLRELIQNSLDAGSDRAEVVLETHAEVGAEPDTVVFELRISDSGSGMDEAVIDNGLTRLFASTKADDRTMAGGYGVGFVSVFAWEPEVVLVQTGRDGEAWELVFHPDRRFEKTPLAEPVEGTTVTLLRRGRASERPAIAEAVRDSLWRWCRFCKLEVSFEDVAGGEPPELIEDRPAPADSPLTMSEVQADTTIHVGFAVPPTAVLLRRGLILAEGAPGELLGTALPGLGRTAEHVQVWIDSPQLRTTIARDKVVDDAGQRMVLGRAAAAIEALRGRLLATIEAMVVDPAPWSAQRHAQYAHLHAHLGRELAQVGARGRELALLRDVAGERGWSVRGLLEGLGGRPVVTAGVEALGGSMLAAAARVGFPVIAAQPADGPWLTALLGPSSGPVVTMARALWREQSDSDDDEREPLRAAVERGLLAAGVVVRLRLGAQAQAQVGERPGLVGVELGADASGPLVLYGPGPWLASAWRAATLWIEDGLLLRAAHKAFASAPRTAAVTLACAVAAALGRDGGEASEIAGALADLTPGTGPGR